MNVMKNSDIREFILFTSNKSQRGGYLDMAEFNSQLKAANLSHLKVKCGLSEEYTPNDALPREAWEKTQTSADELRKFKVFVEGASLTSGKYTLPADYFRYSSIRTSDALEDVDIVKDSRLGRRIKNPITAPTEEYPIAVYYSDYIQVYPTTITNIDFTYIKVPEEPFLDWYINADGDELYLDEGQSYTLQAGEEYRDGTTVGTVNSITKEVLWDDANKIDLAYIILQNLGINLSRTDIVQYSTQKDKME